MCTFISMNFPLKSSFTASINLIHCVYIFTYLEVCFFLITCDFFFDLLVVQYFVVQFLHFCDIPSFPTVTDLSFHSIVVGKDT